MTMELLPLLGGAVTAAVLSAALASAIYLFLARAKPPQTRRERALLAELQQSLQELRGAIIELYERNPRQPPVTVEALVESAGTERLDKLQSAMELRAEHREHEAIYQLQAAFEPEMNPLQRAELEILIGNGFLNLSELEEAEGYYRQALDHAIEAGESETQATALGNLGIVYADRGNLDKAQAHFKKALEIDQHIGNRLGQANHLGNLGLLCARRRDLDRAEEHHKKALAIDEEMGNRVGQAEDLGNLGLVYFQRGELDKAEEHHKKALAIFDAMGNRLGQASELGNLGLVYAERGQLDKAEEHHRKALAIDEEIGDRLGQAHALSNLGLLTEDRGRPEEARHLLQQAQALYAEIGAGGPGPELAREALERLEAPASPEPRRKRARKKPPSKKP